MSAQAQQLIASLAQQGITLSLRDGKLTATPSGLLTEALRDQIRPLRSEIIDFLADSSEPPHVEEVLYTRVSDVQAKPINWLWPARLAKGKINIIVGNPGLGKSQVCASIASVVSKGGQWPVDRTYADVGSVILLSAEDDIEDTIRPRLEAAGADLSKVYLLQAIETISEQGEKEKRSFSLSADIARLSCLMRELGDVALVIIDPITAYLGKADSHKNAEVRALLAPLQDLASQLGAAVLAVSHMTKAQGVDALQRVQGSIAFAAAARSVWGVAKDKNNPARRLFLPLKNNLGTDKNGFAYTLESFVLEGSDPPIGTSHVMWEANLVTESADEVFGGAQLNYEEHNDLEQAKDFLRGLLADGPIAQKQIEADAKGAGHAWATIRRAQQALKIDAFKEDFRGGWKWRLPAEPTPRKDWNDTQDPL